MLLLARSGGSKDAAIFGLFFFFFLSGILFSLTLSTPHTLGGMPLVTKGGPTTKVLTTLAPFDLHAGTGDDPYIDVAECTETLVLSGNKSQFRVGFGSSREFLVLHGSRRRTGFAAHDTATKIVGKGKGRKVHETNEFGYLCVFLTFNVTVVFEKRERKM